MYSKISIDTAYRLINHGPVVLVCTRSESGECDIAPVAWNCPVAKAPPGVLLAVGSSHKTCDNIRNTGYFAVAVPTAKQADMVRSAGSVSGNEKDKYSEFGIAHIITQEGLKIPEGCVGYIECRLERCIDLDGITLVIGEGMDAQADKDMFDGKVKTGDRSSGTIHHLGGGVFGVVSEEL